MTPLPSIGILETGVPPPSLEKRFGGYDAMIRRMLGDGASYRTYAVRDGVLPAQPTDHSAYVITGSSAGVYDALPWIAPLEAFIRAAHGRVRLVGVCFGHQVMAQALGGRVEKSGKGWGLGLHRYDVKAAPPWMDAAPARIAVAASHQDQVVEAPGGATILAASDFTPFAALAYAGGPSISVQFHPEFERDFAAALIDLRRPMLDPAMAEHALLSLEEPSDADRVGGWIRRFVETSDAIATADSLDMVDGSVRT